MDVTNACSKLQNSGYYAHPVTGLFLSSENTKGPEIDLLALVLREASRYR